ncbi:MAG: site-specific integrase [Candidatus Bathyarchaeota archaeon]|nr:MAG: site-specific integrase [Candidatus Bathyarchaeota archaeon]
MALNTPSSLLSKCQIGVSQPKAAKNLVKVESQIKNRAAGATKLIDAELKGKIVEYTWNLKRNGYAESTITTYSYLLKWFVKRNADLNKPDSIKDVIAMQRGWSQGRKRNAVKAYDLYTKINGIQWTKPKYKPVDKLPFIPTEQEIDSLIGGCCKQMSAFLQILKETGARRGEAFQLKWEDIDFVSNRLRITPLKGSRARIFKMSDKLLRMLHNLPKNRQQIWNYKNLFYLDKGFRRMRKRTAHKLGNPRLRMIHFHTLRHWKATIEYARTKDLLHVQKLLGHHDIKNTMRYVQLVDTSEEERFISKVAMNVKEAAELIELGFEYVTGEYDDGGKLFKKKKLSYLGSWSTPKGSWSSMD